MSGRGIVRRHEPFADHPWTGTYRQPRRLPAVAAAAIVAIAASAEVAAARVVVSEACSAAVSLLDPAEDAALQGTKPLPPPHP
jgi:hypothetical protein